MTPTNETAERLRALLKEHEPSCNTFYEVGDRCDDDKKWPDHFIEVLTAAAPSPDPIGEETCHRCGGPNLMHWHAPSPLWNTVMRDAEGHEPFSGIVCPRCFGEMAREKGVADYFCLTTHDPKVPLPTVFGDGRTWDAAACMWIDAAPPSLLQERDRRPDPARIREIVAEFQADREQTDDRVAVENLARALAWAEAGIPLGQCGFVLSAGWSCQRDRGHDGNHSRVRFNVDEDESLREPTDD